MTSNLASETINDFIALLSAKGLSVEQQKKVVSELEQAVALNLVARLHDRLSVDQQEELEARKPEEIQDILQFLDEKVSPIQVQESLKLATEAVIGKFLEKI